MIRRSVAGERPRIAQRDDDSAVGRWDVAGNEFARMEAGEGSGRSVDVEACCGAERDGPAQRARDRDDPVGQVGGVEDDSAVLGPGGQGVRSAGDGWGEEVGVAEQAGSVGIGGVVEDCAGGSVLADIPVDQQGGVLGQGEGLVAVVGDEDCGGGLAVERGTQVGEQVGSGGGVEAGEGFVE